MQQPFDTPLQDTGDTLAGPLRSPRQMLATQQYDDHHSIHDDATAQLYTASQDGLARRFYLYPSNSDTLEYFWGTALFDFSVSGGVTDAVTVSGSFAAASAIAKQAS